MFIDAIDDTDLVTQTGLLARAAMAAEQHGPELRSAWLERAVRINDAPGPHRRAVDAERARELGRDGRLDEAIALASSVLATATTGETLTRARAQHSRALAALVRDNGASDAALVSDLEAAAQLFRSAGEPAWQATVLIALGFGVYLQRGALELADARLTTAVGLLGAPGLARGLCLTYHAEVLMHIGRLDAAGAALREAEEIGHRLGHDDLIAYAAWTRAELCAQRRDRIGVETGLAIATAHPGTWYHRLAGVDFHANAAEMRLLVGDDVGARAELALADERAGDGDYRFMLEAARARIEATVGDVTRARMALDALEQIGTPRDAPMRWLLLAVCARRAGEESAAAALAARAEHEAVALDDPTRLARREPELLALVSGPTSEPTAAIETIEVRLLGAFTIHHDGRDVTAPPGHAATLAKLIALRGLLTVDEAVDVLWPDTDLDTGRSRLRNLLNRLRSASGPVVERRDPELRLGAGVHTDLAAFEEAARAALAAPLRERGGLARQALAHHGGELLPGDRYADWAVAPRERIHRTYLAMIDLVVQDALDRGDLDEAIGLLDDAIAAEPLELERYAQAARALVVQGRPSAASSLVERAAVVCADLGIALPPALRDLGIQLAP